MTCQTQDTEDWSAVELITGGGMEALPAAVAALINEAMRLEWERFIGVALYERSGARQRYANGYKPRQLKTRMGALDLRVPEVRESGFYPQAPDRGLRADALRNPVKTLAAWAIEPRVTCAGVAQLHRSGAPSANYDRIGAVGRSPILRTRTRH